jgi:hypothetical protein
MIAVSTRIFASWAQKNTSNLNEEFISRVLVGCVNTSNKWPTGDYRENDDFARMVSYGKPPSQIERIGPIGK